MKNKKTILIISGVILAAVATGIGGYLLGRSIEKKEQENFIAELKQEVENEKQAIADKEKMSIEVGGAIFYKDKTNVENISTATNLKTLVQAIDASGLKDTLIGTGPYTVFAPDDTAFLKLTDEGIANILKPENQSQLASILSLHVVPGKVNGEALADGMVLKTIDGKTLNVRVINGKTFINEAMVTLTGAESSNGVVHIIDTVLLP